MYGAIIGDIVGSKYEFHNIHTTDFAFCDNRSYFTDDTVCTIAVLDWLMNCKEKDSKSITEYMQHWTRKYPDAGYGGRFYNWVFSNNPMPYGSYGNGAAMRVSAIAWYAKSDKEAEKLCKTATEITHNHPEGIKGALTLVKCMRMALAGESMREIQRYAISQYPEIADFDYEMLRQTYEFNETCQDTVPQALYCFFISHGYEDCIRKCISIGGDSDTLAAISGALAEAYWGIPEHYVEFFRTKLDKEMVELLDKFYRDTYYCTDGPHVLRFVEAYERYFQQALEEISSGRKRSHWMWYIFPQLKGLGSSHNAEYYGLNGARHASACYNNTIFGGNLEYAFRVIYDLKETDITKVFPYPDYKKLKSCATLFYLLTRSEIFKKVLDKYFNGDMCHDTMLKVINFNIRK